MTDYTPTTEQVRGQFTREQPPPIATTGEKRAEFDRWLEQVKRKARAEAWDEGFADGVNHDLGDWENAPSIINNPYRKEQDS